MFIKVVNPNTTWSMTATMDPPSIESHYDEALAVPGILTEIEKGERDSVDGYVIACFGDPGLDAARELAGSNVTVNAIAPAASTPMTETIRTDERFKDTYLESIPLRRWAEPDEVAESYLFLASEAAGYLTGQVLSVDGGRVMVR